MPNEACGMAWASALSGFPQKSLLFTSCCNLSYDLQVPTTFFMDMGSLGSFSPTASTTATSTHRSLSVPYLSHSRSVLASSGPFYNSKWGTVCYNSSVKVVCRQLGKYSEKRTYCLLSITAYWLKIITSGFIEDLVVTVFVQRSTNQSFFLDQMSWWQGADIIGQDQSEH